MISKSMREDGLAGRLPWNQRPLAIVGMGCRLPGGGDLNEYWNLIASGQSAIQELPFERLDQSTYYSPTPCERPRTMTRLGGIVSPYRGIRNLHRLTSSEVRESDPAHLELFGVMDDAVESAGWSTDSFGGKKTGVYLGHTRGTGRCGEIVYRTLVPQTVRWLRELDGFSQLDGLKQERVIRSIVQDVQNRYVGFDKNRGERMAAFQASSLISKGFGLNGPSLSLNAACASSLAALSFAGEALSVGDIDVAVVGCGSFVEFDSLVLFSRAGSVSKTGSRPFDASADGLIPAEGYVILLVKTLEKALQDADPIMAVIRGFGYSSDGKGKSLWAPREEGQILAIQRAYGDCLTPTRLGYLEAHATSTAVGDATEMKALSRALAETLSGFPKVPVGSVKANIGHTLETAGLAALVKAVLAIRNRQIPPVANLKKPNPNIDWQASPLYLPRELTEWKSIDSQPRRAGVNAFGIGGLNAHVILEEFIPDFSDSYFLPDPECAARSQSVSVASNNNHSVSQTNEDESPYVAIVGLGAIAPGGKVSEEFWTATKDGATHIGEPDAKRWDVSQLDSSQSWPEKIVGGFIRDYQYDWRKHKVAPKQVADADPLQFMLLDAVDQALVDSGITLHPDLRRRTGVVIGSVFGGEFGNALQMGLRLPEFSRLLDKYLREEGVADEVIESMIDRYQALLLSRMPALNDETGSFTSSTLASRITKTFDVMGGGSAIDGGGASGLTALQIAVNSLRARNADLMVCACGQRSIGPFNFELLCHTGALSATGKVSVGSPLSDGLVPGEGAAVVVLKRLDEAIRDGNRIYCVIKGFEQVQCTGVKESFQSLDRSLSKWIEPGELAYVESDANGIAHANDEFLAVQSELTFDNQYRVSIASLKEQIGDTFGASALLSVVRASQALHRGIVPAAAFADEKRLPRHLEVHSSSQVKWDSASSTPAAVVVPSSCDGIVSGVVLGNLASVLKKETTANSQIKGQQHPAWAESNAHVAEPADQLSIFRFGADSISELLHQMQCASTAPNPIRDQSSGTFSFMDASASSEQQPPLYRLNVVAGNRKSLKQKIVMAENALSQGKSVSALQNQGVFFAERGSQSHAKTAFLFAGQGSQYPKMLSTFLQHPAVDQQTIAEIEHATKRWMSTSLEDLLVDRKRRLGTDLLATQFGILSCEVLLYQVLKDMGLTPDFLMGHSFGEYAAIYASGSLDISRAFEAAYYRAQAVGQASVVEGKLICLFCDEEVVSQTISQNGLDAHIANCNSLQQTVIGVPTKSVDSVRQVFEGKRIRTLTLPVPFAFHTPLMANASAVMAERLAEFPMRNCDLPLLSTVTESFESQSEQLRQNLCDQFVKPVRWTRLVQKLRQEGTSLFIEVGPGQVLTGLTRSIFKGDEGVYCVASDDQRTTTAEQLLFVRAVQEIQSHRTDTASSSHQHVTAHATVVDHKKKQPPTPLLRANRVAPPNTKATTGWPDAEQRSIKKLVEATNNMDDISPFKPAADRSGNSLDICFERVAAQTIYRARKQSASKFSARAIAPTATLLADWHEIAREWRTTPQAAFRISRFLETETIKSREQNIATDGTHGVLDQITLLNPACWEDLQWQSSGSKAGLRFATLARRGQRYGSFGINESGITISCAAQKTPLDLDSVTSALSQGPSCLIEEILKNCRTLTEVVSLITKTDSSNRYTWLVSDASGKAITSVCTEGGVSFIPFSGAVDPGQRVVTHVDDRQRQDRIRASANPRSMQLMLQWESWDQSVSHKTTIGFDQLFGLAPSRSLATESSVGTQPPKHDSSPLLSQATETSNVETTQSKLASSGTENGLAPTLPMGDQDRICTRIVPKLIEAHGKERLDWHLKLSNATVLILGDLPTLKSRLEKWGSKVESVVAWQSADELAQIATSLQERLGKIDHVIAAPWFANQSVRGGAENTKTFDFDRDVMALYRLAQVWFTTLGDAPSSAERSFITVTKMGGDLGLTGQSHRHIDGVLTGLSKAMFLERAVMVGPDLRTHAIDFELDADETYVSDRLLSEWAQETREAEVGYRSQRRYVLRSTQEVLPRPAAGSDQSIGEGCWIVTGGARGVTAEIAKAIASRCTGTIHLVGSSPIPSIPQEWLQFDETSLRALRTDIARKAAVEKRPAAEQWNAIEKAIEIERNFQAMRNAGMSFRYHACDVSSLEAVQALVASIRSFGEPIVGVVHGAGFEKASRFSSKKLPLVKRTFDSKALGALNLMQATDSDPVKSFVAFASISGRYGAIGQTDYSSANEWLTKIVARYANEKPHCHAVALDWHSWGDVGMAARPETKHSPMLKTMRFMPVGEGVEHFLAEVQLGQTALKQRGAISHGHCPAEVVITDWNYHTLYFPDSSVPPTANEEVVPSVDHSYQSEQWVASPVATEKLLPPDGLCLVVGSNATAKVLSERLLSQGCQTISVPSVTCAADAEQLSEIVCNVAVKNIYWLSSLDHGAYLGNGWKKERDRLDHFVSTPKQLVRTWAERMGANRLRLVVAGNCKPLQESDDFFGQSFTPEASWLASLLREHPTLVSSFTVCKTVWISNHRSPSAQSQSLFEESCSVEVAAQVHRSGSGRWVSKMESVQLPPTAASSISTDPGTWVAVSCKSEADQLKLAEGLGIAPDRLMWLSTSKWMQIQKELRSVADPASVHRLEGMQFTEVVNPLQAIRDKRGDNIVGIVFCDSVEGTPDAFADVEHSKLISQVMISTQPDNVRIVVGLNSSQAGLVTTSEWMRWHALRRGIRAAMVLGYNSQLNEALRTAMHALPAEPGTVCLQNSKAGTTKADSQSASQAAESLQLAFSPRSSLVNDTVVCEVIVDPIRDPFLAQHRFRGRPLMPLVGIAELMAQSAVSKGLVDNRFGVAIESLVVENGLKFVDDSPKSLFIKLVPTGKSIQATLYYSFADSRGRIVAPERVVATASLHSLLSPAKPQPVPFLPTAPWHVVGYPGEESVIYHGPAFRCLQKTQYFENGMIGGFEAQRPSALGGDRVGEWLTPMGVIDSALFACGILAWTRDSSTVAIPSGIDGIRIYSQSSAGHAYLGIFTIDQLTANEGRFSGMVQSQDGEVLFEMTSYRATLVKSTIPN